MATPSSSADHVDDDDDEDDEVLLVRVPQERDLSPFHDEPPTSTTEDTSVVVIQTSAAHISLDDESPLRAAPAPKSKKYKRKLDESPRATPPPQSPTHDSSTHAISPVFVPSPHHFPPGFFCTRSHPWNKATFRYQACGPPPLESLNQDKHFREYPIYYTIETPPTSTVRFAWEDRSTYIHIDRTGTRITTDKGFRSARANVPIRQGKWYFEVEVERGGGDLFPMTDGKMSSAHVRIGIGRRESGLNAPPGIDGYSYAIRDKTGDKVHVSKSVSFSQPFKSGDVIGVFVDLPVLHSPQRDSDKSNPGRVVRKRIPIRYRGQLYFETLEYASTKEMEDLAESACPSHFKAKTVTPQLQKVAPGTKVIQEVKPVAPLPRPLLELPNSRLAFFKNGECMGIAFRNLLDFLPLRPHPTLKGGKKKVTVSKNTSGDVVGDGSWARENFHDDGTLGYYPFVGVFGGGVARLNAGPTFTFPPPDNIESVLEDHQMNDHPGCRDWKPLSELYPDYLKEQRRLDGEDAEEQYKAYVREELIEQSKEKHKSTLTTTPSTKRGKKLKPPNSPTSSGQQVSMLKGIALVKESSRPGTPLSHEWKPDVEEVNEREEVTPPLFEPEVSKQDTKLSVMEQIEIKVESAVENEMETVNA